MTGQPEGSAAGGGLAPRIPVFICGEPARGDDAAAFAAAALLPGLLTPRSLIRSEVLPVGQLDLVFLLDLPDGAPCVVADAVAGLPPGTVWVRPLADLVGGARAGPLPRSSHELPVEQVLALAATLRPNPPAGLFVGLAGERWTLGGGLSAAVAAAIPAFARAIADAVELVLEG